MDDSEREQAALVEISEKEVSMTTAMVPIDAIQRMAEVAAKSKLFGVQTVEQAMTIMLIAQAEGRHPMSAAKDYDVINGKPAKKAEAMLRDFLASGGKVEWHKLDDRGAEATQLRQALQFTKAPVARATDMLHLKRFLDGLRNSSSFRFDPNLVPKQEEYKVAADLVRATLHKQPDLSPIINEERIFIQAFDAIVDDAVRRGNRQLLSLTDAIIGGGGLASGVPGTGFGAMAAVRLFQQPPTLTTMGQGLYRTGKVIPAGTAATTTRAGAASASR